MYQVSNNQNVRKVDGPPFPPDIAPSHPPAREKQTLPKKHRTTTRCPYNLHQEYFLYGWLLFLSYEQIRILVYILRYDTFTFRMIPVPCMPVLLQYRSIIPVRTVFFFSCSGITTTSVLVSTLSHVYTNQLPGTYVRTKYSEVQVTKQFLRSTGNRLLNFRGIFVILTFFAHSYSQTDGCRRVERTV